jgi:hypothetical protein
MQMKKIRYLVFFLLGAVSVFITYNVIEMVEVANEVVVAVDIGWLEGKLFAEDKKEEYHKKDRKTLIDKLLVNITSVFTDSSNNITGYAFYTDSAFQGYARIERQNGIVHQIDIYTIYDTTLYDYFDPSRIIYFFHLNNQQLIFNGINEKMTLLQENNQQKNIEKGIPFEVLLNIK